MSEVRFKEKDTHGRGGFAAALRAEARKSAPGAPMRLAVLLALPFPLLGGALSGRFAGGSDLAFSAWNYYYVLLLPVTVVLVCVCVAAYDARLKNHVLLSCGVPLARMWVAKVLWCLALALLGNMVVWALYAVGSAMTPKSVSVTSMLAAALACTLATAWMIPTTLFLTNAAGKLAGIFVPLFLQLAGEFTWSLVPAWPALPPAAAIILPSAFLPVLPTGEPASAAPQDLLDKVGSFGPEQAVACVVCAAVFVLLAVVTAAWFARSEEL